MGCVRPGLPIFAGATSGHGCCLGSGAGLPATSSHRLPRTGAGYNVLPLRLYPTDLDRRPGSLPCGNVVDDAKMCDWGTARRPSEQLVNNSSPNTL